MLSGSTGGLLSCHLGGVRSRFAGTLETNGASGGPHNGVPADIRDIDDRVVEAGRDVRLPMADVFAFAATDPLLLLFCQLQPLLRDLFLTGDRNTATLTGPRIGVGALPTNRKAATVADPLVAADLNLSLYVLLNFPPQVTFNAVVVIDEPTDLGDLVIGELTDPGVGVDSGFGAYLLRPGEADAVYVGEPDLEPFVAWEVNSRNSCHWLVNPQP